MTKSKNTRSFGMFKKLDCLKGKSNYDKLKFCLQSSDHSFGF